MAQYTDEWGDPLPELGDDGNAWPLDYNGNIERNSRAIPARARLVNEGGTAYAIVEGDVLASGADHTAVIQTAIDWLFDTHASFEDNKVARQIQGWIDGGGETFDVSSTVRFRDQIGLANIHLDAGGSSLADGILAPEFRPDFPQLKNSALRWVRATNNGGGPGINYKQVFAGNVNYCTAANNSGAGLRIPGSITVTVLGGGYYGNGAAGIEITDTQETHGNVHRVYWAEIRQNDPYGIHIHKNTRPGDDTDQNLIESCDFEGSGDGIGVYMDTGARSTTVRNNWFEGNERMVINGRNRPANHNRLHHNKLREIVVKNGSGNILGHNFASEYSQLNIIVDSTASDTFLNNNFYDEGALDDQGVRTVQNGAGTNAGDPSTAGEWSGSGWEGLVVYDTSAARPYPAYRHIDGAWQTA